MTLPREIHCEFERETVIRFDWDTTASDDVNAAFLENVVPMPEHRKTFPLSGDWVARIRAIRTEDSDAD